MAYARCKFSCNVHVYLLVNTQDLFDTAPPEGLLRRSRSRFGGATNCGSSKTAPAPLFFTEKRLFQENIWQGSSGGAGAGAGEKPCQTSPNITLFYIDARNSGNFSNK